MALLGLTTTYVATLGSDGNALVGTQTGGLSDTGVYEIDTLKKNGNLGATVANVTGLSGTVQKVPGNNQVVDVVDAPAAPSVALTYNQINVAVKQALLGRKLENGGYVDTDEVVEAALIIESRDEVENKPVYFAFPRGVFKETAQNIQSNTDTTVQRETESLTFTAMASQKINNKPFKIYFATAEGFSKKKMFDEVFGSTQKFITEESPKSE